MEIEYLKITSKKPNLSNRICETNDNHEFPNIENCMNGNIENCLNGNIENCLDGFFPKSEKLSRFPTITTITFFKIITD